MRLRHVLSCALMFVTLIAGCDRNDPVAQAPPAPAPASAPAPALAPTPPPPEALPVRNTPEDLTVDAERDPRVRERAKEMNAIAVDEMRNLDPDTEVAVLVRGDRGGGTIYGSGPYTLDSQIRKAVVHNGALKDRELGLVRVKVIKHDGDHPSVPKNGIVPTKWGKYHTSYTIEKIDVP